jgi:plastocyanin
MLAAGAATSTAGIAGCNGRSGVDTEEEDTASSSSGSTATPQSTGGDAGGKATVEAAVAAGWNAMRARLCDAPALGRAGEMGSGAAVAQHTFARFEQASGDRGAHEILEATSETNYEASEERIGAVSTAAGDGGDVYPPAKAFNAGAVDSAYATVGSGSGGGGCGGGSDLQGGPNVGEGVPDEADHVVDMTAVAYEAAELAVSQGGTVTWTYAGGDPHSASAYRDGIPDGATNRASGGFDTEQAARTGSENGQGAIRSGRSHVPTFETSGAHEYFYIPNEAAGMAGTVTAE